MPSTYENLIALVREATDSTDALERLDAAIAVSAESTAAGDQVLDHFVAQARQAGHSWTEVGARLGVSKQAARQRFVERTTPFVLPGAARPAPRLQACLQRAESEAQADGAAEIGTQHLLAGLLAEGVAAAILESQGVSAESIRDAGHRLFGPGGSPSQDVPAMSDEAICALDVAARHAAEADPDSESPLLRTEHLLFALAVDSGGRARRVLNDMGADTAGIKRELERSVSCPPQRRSGRWKRARTSGGAACSFCGRPARVTGRLVAGPGVHICPACVALSVEIIEREQSR